MFGVSGSSFAPRNVSLKWSRSKSGGQIVSEAARPSEEVEKHL